ncbi:hypothetical protein HQ520_16055, partial [bacterium]|nr:hypothetical protein [bacterium]
SANYPGYYITHMSTIYMKPDYPYEGPSVSVIEYTHIPAYLAKLQDFLIAQAWSWSDQGIEFPWLRQYRYAYFDNKVYGFAPGKFFDQDDMWIWLKRGLIEVDNVQIDWLGARKEGLFAAALMNEDGMPIDVTVTLGDEITGGAPFSGTAAFYSMGEAKTTTTVTGQFVLTVPAKGLVGVTVESDKVQQPRYAYADLTDVNSTDTGLTVALPQGGGDFGTGYVLQIDPYSYFAYTFLPYKPDEVQSAILYFRIGDGEWQSQTVGAYPFEHIQEVVQVNEPFTFYWDIVDDSGTPRQSAEKQLLPFRSPANANPVWDRF